MGYTILFVFEEDTVDLFMYRRILCKARLIDMDTN